MTRDVKVALAGMIAMGLVIWLSNYLVQFPLPGVYFGITLGDWFTYGAFSYPFCFLVSDLVNRTAGVKLARWVAVAGFVIGVPLSWWFADARIALASGSAFLIGQMVDITIFARLRQLSWWKAPLVSSSVASVLDSGLFFSLAFAGTGLPWLSMGLGDLSVKFLMDFALLPLFRLAILWVPMMALPSQMKASQR